MSGVISTLEKNKARKECGKRDIVQEWGKECGKRDIVQEWGANFNFLFFGQHCPACGILVPQPRLKPAPPALEAQSLNPWTAREVPQILNKVVSLWEGDS